jgi:hypothetical protein
MDRKQFLSTCAAGLCACAAGSLIPASSLSAAEPASPEDWRLTFVKERYAKVLQMLSERLSEKELDKFLREVGAFYRGAPQRFRGLLQGGQKRSVGR